MVKGVRAKKIEIFDNQRTKYSMAKIKKKTGCDYIINGGIFNFGTLKPLCHLKVDGKVLTKDKYKYWGYAFNTGSNTLKMVSEYSQYDNYICCVAMIKDWTKLNMNYNKDMGGKRGRTAIGTRADGTIILFCGKDGTSSEMTPEQLQEYMVKQGCRDAIMLDGGGSSQAMFNDTTISSSRIVSNYILIWEDKDFIPKGKEPTSYYVRNGSRNDGARWVQSMLQRIGYRIDVDGIFGKDSTSALKDFQTYWGIEVDGVVGADTRKSLKKCVNTIENSDSKSLRIFTGELGRTEKRGEDDKYILWYNSVTKAGFSTNVPWCAISASWANRRGEISEANYPNFASCTSSLKIFASKGLVRDKNSYVPKPGDMIYFDWDGNKNNSEHVGLVLSYDGKYVETIEGNSKDAVRHKKYPINSKFIYKYVEVK